MRIIKQDTRVRPVHLGVYLALYDRWLSNDCQSPIYISRRIIMQSSKIASLATYHKTMQELVDYGYIQYYPAFDPSVKSQVALCIVDEFTSPSLL